MTEAIGLAASVAGLVSLGLQITGGIVTYVNAVEGRQNDLASVKRQNDAFAATLNIVRAASARFQGHQHDQTIKLNLLSCEAELHALEELLAKLANCDTATWRQQLKNKTRKFTYVFHQSKVQQMLQRLQHANEGLQLAVTALGLDTSGSNSDTLTRIEASSNLNASELLLLRSEVGAAVTPLTDIRHQLPLLQKEVAATTDLVISHHTITSTQLQQNHHAIQQDILRSEDSIKEALHMGLTSLEQRLLGSPQSPGAYQQSAIALARRAAGTPDALRELCDSVPALHKPQYTSATGLICICHRTYRSSKRKTMRLGHFAFTNEQGSEGHWPSCPLSTVLAPRKRRRAVGLRYSGLASILQTMIDVTFTTTFGAGGFSIGPSVTYYPLVDSKADPAFRILELLEDYFDFDYCSDDHPIPFVEACLKNLVKLFDEKKACPTAISYPNHSLMHATARMVNVASEYNVELRTKLFPEMIQTLLWYGVPAFTYDHIGRSPLLMLETFRLEGTLDVRNLIAQANSENKPAIIDTGHLVWYQWATNYIPIYEACYSFAEVCECGPLSMAVIRNDLGEVTRILERFPHALSETDVFGQSPLHLAVSKAGVLSLLVKAADLDQLDHQDKEGLTALEAAMLVTSDQCVNGLDPERCQSCDCAKCVHILLEAGCSVRTTRIPYRTNGLDLNEILKPASELARQRYIFHMQKLRISPRLYERPRHKSMPCYGTSSSHHIRAVEGNSPQRGEAHCISGVINGGKDWSWVYQEIDNTEFADLFYANGFRPGASFFLHQYWWRLRTEMDAAYFCWLVEHGADLLSRSLTGPPEADYSSEVGVFGAHHAFFVMGRTIADFLSLGQRDQALVELSTKVLRRNLTDGCECYCSAGGCSPFTWMIKGMALAMATTYSHRTRGLRGYEYCAQLYYGSCGMELTVLTFKSAIRFFTFQALGLGHTCCLMEEVVGKGFDGPDTEPRDQWLKRDDVSIINEEQSFLLKMHEELVAEFIEAASGYLEVKSDSSEEEPEHFEEASEHLVDASNSSDLFESLEDTIECSTDGSEYSEESSHDDPGFSRFWSEYWMVRMEEKLEELEGNQITDAERQGAEAVGVQWQEESEEAEKHTRLNPYRRKELDWWFFELNLICPGG